MHLRHHSRSTRQMSPGTKKLMGFFFALAGFVMLYFSWHTYNSTNEFLETALSAPGVVVELERRQSSSTTSSGSGPTYAPVVEFTAPESGETITFTSSSSSNPPAFDKGEDVTVLYAPDNPNDARIDSFTDLWLLPLILLGMGIIFAPVGIGVMRSSGNQESV